MLHTTVLSLALKAALGMGMLAQQLPAELPWLTSPGLLCPNSGSERFVATSASDGQRVAACDFINANNGMLRGVAANDEVVVTPQPVMLSPMGPLPAQVSVTNRYTGQPAGLLADPPGGWQMPFGAKFVTSTKLMVIDIGPFTNDVTAPFTGFIAEYQRTAPGTYVFSRKISLVGYNRFIADCEPVPGNRYVCADQIGGALVMVYADGTSSIVLGNPMAPPGFGPPQLALGVQPPGDAWHFSRYPQETPLAFTPVPPMLGFPPGFTFVPGANYLAHYGGNGGEIYWFNVNTQKFYSIPLSVLSDAQDPLSRTASITEVANVLQMPFADGTTDFKAIIGAMSFKRSNPQNPWLYIPDPMRARVVRFNVQTHEWAVVIADVHLMDSPSNLQLNGEHELWVCSDQEEGLGFLNSALTPPPGWPDGVPYTDFRGSWKIMRVVLGSE